MVLYETIVIAKPGPARKTMNLLKSMIDVILSSGGTVRDVSVLGDRLLAHDLKGKDKHRYHVGRYVQFLYDVNPRVKPKVKRTSGLHSESLKTYFHRQNDLTDEAIAYRRTARMTTPIVSPSERNADFLAALRQAKQKLAA